MTASTSTDREYTNGRLILTEEMAFDILEAVEAKRVQTLLLRAELREQGLDDATAYLTQRLRRWRRISSRILRLADEKEWGDASVDADADASEE